MHIQIIQIQQVTQILIIIISEKILIQDHVIIQTLPPEDQILIISKHRQSQEKVKLVPIPNVAVYLLPPPLKVNI
jgi:hypothetical protein